MTTKRDRTPEQRLSEIIRLLERNAPGEARVALFHLFSDGPLLASDFGIEDLSDEDLHVVSAALLAQLRWLIERPDTPLLWTATAPVTYAFLVHQRRPVLGLVRPKHARTTAVRDVAQLLLALFLREVGLVNVVQCAAPGCPHRFIRFHKRTFCSPTCQKRVYMQRRRANEQYARDRKKKKLRLVRQHRKGA
jgi:hypothetical protein